MSSQLLFTASSQQQFGDWGVGIENDPDTAALGIENPNNYKNDLRNTIKIPKHSEIAVVNCEINRDVGFALDFDDRFYWWYGELLEALNVNQVGNLPFPILLSEVLDTDEDGMGQYEGLDLTNLSADRYCELIQEAMRACICDPGFFRTATCNIDPASSGRKMKFTITSTGKSKALTAGLGIPDYTVVPPIQSYFGIYQQNKADVNWDTDWTVTTSKGGIIGDTFTRQRADSSRDIENRDPDGLTKLLGDWDDYARVICRTLPLSRVDGKWWIDFAGCAGGGFEFGLTRPQTNKTYRGSNEITRFRDTPGNALRERGDLTNQCDYVVKYWDEGNTGTKKIHFYQLVRYTEPPGELNEPEGYSYMKEVIYWHAGGVGGRPTAQITEADIFGAGKGYRYLEFHLKGEALQTRLSNDAAFSAGFPGVEVTILTTTFTDDGSLLQHTLKTGLNTQALYPLISIADQNESCVTTKYDTFDDTKVPRNWEHGGQYLTNNPHLSYNYPLDKMDRCNTYEITGEDPDEDGDDETRPWVGGASFYGWAVANSNKNYTEDWGSPGYVGWMWEYLKTRNIKLNGMTDDSSAYRQIIKYLDANDEAPDLEHGIITEKGDWGDTYFDSDGVYPTPDDDPPNMATKLGVKWRSLFQTIDGSTMSITKVPAELARGRWEVVGKDDFGEQPDLMLIEVPNFNHQCYNMSTSVPSKFVYVVPRSDHTGQVSGKLFHEAPDRYYSSLNNPDDIYLNHIEVRFTDKNGVTTTDLTGSSAVTFHVQPERGRILGDVQRAGPFGGA